MSGEAGRDALAVAEQILAQHRQPRLGSCLAAGDASRGGPLSADRPRAGTQGGLSEDEG